MEVSTGVIVKVVSESKVADCPSVIWVSCVHVVSHYLLNSIHGGNRYCECIYPVKCFLSILNSWPCEWSSPMWSRVKVVLKSEYAVCVSCCLSIDWLHRIKIVFYCSIVVAHISYNQWNTAYITRGSSLWQSTSHISKIFPTPCVTYPESYQLPRVTRHHLAPRCCINVQWRYCKSLSTFRRPYLGC